MATTAGGSSAGGEQPTEQVAVAAANDAPAPPPAAPPAIQQAPAPVNLTTTQVDENVIEAEINDDNDSTLGDESGSELNYGSVTSSIYNYRQENGRTYHAYSDGKYLIPNDEKEQDRMDIVYHALLTVFGGKAFFAPLKNPQRIADMGTGTGIWALDVGDQFPEAHVIGIDLSPIQPKWTSPNVEFRIDDIEQPWVFDTPLDFVHSRICSGNAIRSWPKYFAEAFQALKPGGWVEAQEFTLAVKSDDDSLPKDSAIVKWHNKFHEGMLIAGCDLSVGGREIGAWMEEAGFINVNLIEMKLPMAPWPKEKRLKDAGAYAMLSILEDLTGMSLAVFTRLLGWDRIELELFLQEVKKEWKRKDVHSYWPLFAVYGQKPGGPSDEPEVEVETQAQTA